MREGTLALPRLRRASTASRRGVAQLLHRPARARRARGGRAGAVRRVHARTGLGPRARPAPARHPGRLLVRAGGARCTQLLATRRVRARADRCSTSAPTPAGRRTTSRSAGLERRPRSTSSRRSCRGCTPPTTSSRTGRRTSSACSGSMNDDAARLGAASTTCTAARSCTTTTRAGCGATFEEAYRVLKPGGRLLVVNETLKTLRDPTASTSRPSSSSRATSTPTGRLATAGRRSEPAFARGARARLPRLLRLRAAPQEPRPRRQDGAATARSTSCSRARVAPARLPGVAQQRRRRRLVRHDRHQAARPASARRRRAARGLRGPRRRAARSG